MMYIDSKTAEMQKNNRWARVIMAVTHCCLWCLEKCARFLTYSAYIMISIEGVHSTEGVSCCLATHLAVILGRDSAACNPFHSHL